MVYFFCYMYLTNMWFSAVLFESAPKHLQVCMALDGEFSSICAEAHGWANPSFFTFGKFVLQMTRYLLQLLRRVFAFHQCPFHTRASLGFCTFCFHNLHRKGLKNVGVFLEKVQRFSLFLRRFLKNVGRFYELLPTFLKVGCSLKIMGCCESHFFLFSCRKNASFQHSSVKVVKAKKRKSQGTRPRVACAREKPLFFEQNVTLIMSAPSRRNSPDFYIPFCRILAPNGTIVSNLMKRMALPSRYYDFAP